MLSMKSQPRKIPWLALHRLLIKRILFFSILLVLNPLNFNALQAVDNLGLRIDVLPNSNADNAEPYSQNRRLWLVTSEARSTTRTIRITSSVGNSQSITLEIAAARNVGGASELDMDNESEIAPWTKFSKSSFVLPAFGQTEIQVTINPPKDLKDYSQDAFLIVKAAATSGPKIDKTRTTAVLASQFQYATPLFYGVGKIENLMNIQIKDVDTYIDENGKYAEVEIANNGVGPVEINGDIQFTNLDFQTTNVGPLLFTLPPLQPGKSGFGVLRLPDQMVAGNWKIFVQAYVGSYGEAAVITKNLTFDYKQNSQLPRIILFIASLLILISLLFLQKRLRKKISPASEVEVEKIGGERRLVSPFKIFRRLTKPKKNPSVSDTLVDLEVKAWLEKISANASKNQLTSNSIRPRLILKKKVLKKAPSKKAVVKKKSRKAPIKKRASKKALPKKKTAKKVALKK
jgi:hypothetical protein